MAYRIILIIAVLTALWNPPANASIAKRLSLKALLSQSTSVVHGKVAFLTSYWSRDRTRIFTEVAFDITRVAYGSIGNNRIRIVVDGGTVGTIKTFVTGSPQFVTGEEAVLFLKPGSQPANGMMPQFVVVGAIQGKFSIERYPSGSAIAKSDAANGQVTLMPDSAGLVSPPGSKAGLPLEELLKQISALQAGK
jgi:hypothetical protein